MIQKRQNEPQEKEVESAAETDRPPASEAERDLLISACRDKNRRFVERTRERPTEWRPYEVLVPDLAEFNICYTDNTAFEFAAEQISAGYAVKKIALRHPQGSHGYEMTFLRADHRVLYVKLELKGQSVFGRSFHFSTKIGI